MTEPATGFDPKLVPFVHLAGKKWPIPELAPRQNRHIRRALFDLTDRLQTTTDGSGQVLVSLSNEDYENLVIEVVYQGLTRAHAKLTRDEFLDMTIGETDMLVAWFVVRRQSGQFKAVASGDQPQGEAAAA